MHARRASASMLPPPGRALRSPLRPRGIGPAAALFALVAALLATAPPLAAAEPADLVLTNARIFTGDPQRPWAEALAIRGERVVAVGTPTDVAPHRRADTRVRDLAGRLVIPGINDAHVHAPFGSGETSARLDIPADASAADMLALVEAEVARQPAGTLITGQLSPARIDTAPTRADLDRVAPAHPVRLAPPGGHSALLNSAALAAWDITDDADDPAGGWYGRDGNRLDGWLYEHAYWLPQQRLAEALSDAHYLDAMRAFEDEALRHGISSVQTMPLVAAERIEELLARMQPRLRWRVIDFRLAPFDGAPAPRPVKYVLDGTPIERSAALRTPYADDASTAGRMNYTGKEIATMVANAATGTSQLLVHAVGDASVEAVLDAMGTQPGVDWPARRVRLEHADGLADDQLEAARKLGVVVVQNPAHFMGGLAPPRLGPARSASYQKARSLRAGGIHFALGSDGPLNPYLNMLFALRHPNPDEALPIEDALRAYTAGAAYAEFTDADKGRLMPGMLADLAVLSQDITRIPPDALPATHSVLTIVGGKIAWEAPAPAAPQLPAKRM